jgi:hypothetical protein
LGDIKQAQRQTLSSERVARIVLQRLWIKVKTGQ